VLGQVKADIRRIAVTVYYLEHIVEDEREVGESELQSVPVRVLLRVRRSIKHHGVTAEQRLPPRLPLSSVQLHYEFFGYAPVRLCIKMPKVALRGPEAHKYAAT
jgi:hypothetical protein